MFCCNCGAQCTDNAKFCPKCGVTLNPVSAQTNSTFNNTQGTYQNSMPAMGQMNMNQSTTKRNPNIIGIIAGALLIICTFLPYVSFSAFGISAAQTLIDGGDGVFFIIIGIATIIFSILGMKIVVIIAGILACILTVIEIVDLTDIARVDFGNLLQRGIGFYTMIIASIATLVAVPVWNSISKKSNA